MKRTCMAFILAATMMACASGCAKPAPQSPPNPDAALLAGQWEQFIPIESMPQAIALDASGAAEVDNVSGRWRLEPGSLFIRQGGQEDKYSYTVTGYMLTLYDTSTDTSEFYINPQIFAAGADKNASFKGQWAAWSTFGKMSFDGGTGLDNIVYTTTGRTDLTQKYAARDGILQTVDADGNYTYNLFSFGGDGALLLAETTDYDNENKQWTAYWKTAPPASGLLGEWTQIIDTSPGGAGLPAVLTLGGDGAGGAAAQGKSAAAIKWEYYGGGFILIEYSETNLQYAWCSQQGGALYLGNPDVDEAWYIDSSRLKPTAAPLKDILGTWKLEDSKLALAVKSNGTVEVTNEAGETTALDASAADGILKLERSGKTYYMAYSVDGGSMKLYYGQLPFLEQKEMPVTLVKS